VLDDVPFEQMRPGDILWWHHHVGLYVGNGEMIDAYDSRAGVVRRRLSVPQRVLRVVAPRSPLSNAMHEFSI
jgi:cell wall-associated NlpC family hydrolase